MLRTLLLLLFASFGLAVDSVPLVLNPATNNPRQLPAADNLKLLDGQDLVTGTTTGSMLATSSSQKLAAFGATPIVQPSGNALTGLSNLGWISSPTLSAADLTSGTLVIARGGTNSGTALSGSSIMVSNGSAIIQGAAGTSTTVLHGNAAGVPTYGAVTLTTDVTGILPSANGGTGVNNAGTITNASNTTITGGGTLDLASFTLTVPATGTVGLLGVANTWTLANNFTAGLTATAFSVGVSPTAPTVAGICYISRGSNAPALVFQGTGTNIAQIRGTSASTIAITNAAASTTIMEFNGTGPAITIPSAAAILTHSGTTSASSSIAGAFVVGNGVAATSVAVGGGIIRTGSAVYAGDNIDANNFILCGVRSASSGGGGNIRYRDDTATSRWLSGILGGAAAVDYVLYDIVGGATRLTLTPAGLLTLSAATGTHTISSTTDSTSKDTGSFITEGGVGIEKSATVGTVLGVGGAPVARASFYTATDTTPATVSTWDTRHVILGVGTAGGAGLGFSVNHTSGASFLSALAPGVAWKEFAIQAASFKVNLSGASTVLTVHDTGGATIAPLVRTSGSPFALTITGAAHTTLAASTEAPDLNINLARTVQFATGALTTQRAARFQAPTYGFVGASTITNAATVSISGAPAAGTNATITNPLALWVESGQSFFDGAPYARHATQPEWFLTATGSSKTWSVRYRTGATALAFTEVGVAEWFTIADGTGAVSFGGTLSSGAATVTGALQVNAGGIKTASASAGLGYSTGAGGAVTQATSKSTGVTLNNVCGAITMNNASLAAATSVGFTLTNSAIAAADAVIVTIKSGATADSYTVTVDAVAAGSCRISLRNVTAGSLGEAVVVTFVVVKGVTS